MIRPINKNDILQMAILGKDAHAESIWSDKEYTPLHSMRVLSHCVDNGIAFLDERDGEISGWIWGDYSKNIFAESMQANCISLYVVPKYRTGSIGLKLIKAFINKAKQDEIDEILLGTISMKDEKERNKVNALFKRIGAKSYGHIWRAV